MSTLTDDQLERIDRYLAADLDANDRAEIAKLIETDQAWKEALALRIAAREASKKVFHQSMRRRFHEIDAGENKRRMIQPIWLAVAASVALLVSAVLWLFPSENSNSLLAEYQTFPNVVLPIEKSGAEITDRQKAYQSYELGEYPKAIEYFTSLDTMQTVDRLYLGLAYLESGNLEAATNLMDEVRASSNPRWSHVADWYQAWLLLKQENNEAALNAFERIANTVEHRYQSDAAAIVEKLKQR
jgi:hypothetical protein